MKENEEKAAALAQDFHIRSLCQQLLPQSEAKLAELQLGPLEVSFVWIFAAASGRNTRNYLFVISSPEIRFRIRYQLSWELLESEKDLKFA
jgi:hypothetical protein